MTGDDLMLLRTRLPNGAVIVAETIPRLDRVEIQLWCSSKNSSGDPGIRHMLEHIIARNDKSIDTKLEKVGGYLNAATFRDGMQFAISVPKAKIDLAIECLQRLVQFPNVTPGLVRAETLTLEQEALLKPQSLNESNFHWKSLVNPASPDPAGPDTWSEFPAPSTLNRALKSQMSAECLTVVVVSDLEVDASTKLVQAWLSSMPIHIDTQPEMEPRNLELDKISVGQESLGLAVDGFPSALVLARVAAGLALVSNCADGYFIYTPSALPGVVTVGSAKGLTEIKKSVRDESASSQFKSGKRLLQKWINSQISNPQKLAELRGMLSCQRGDVILKKLPEMLNALSWTEFEKAYTMLERSL